MRSDGFPVEQYDGPEGVGLLIPSDASFNPLMRCRLLANEAIENGARLFEDSHAVSIEGDSVTIAGGGSISCDKVIVAVDGNLESIFPELHGRVRTARLQMLATEPVPENIVPRPVYYRYGYDYWQQLPNGRVFVGGARDSESDAEWTTVAEVSDGIQKQLDDLLRNRIGVSQAVSHRWAALVSYTDDEMPLFEEVRPGVIAIGAYSGTGNVIGALYGRRAAEIAAARNYERPESAQTRRFLLF
jgi:glycine/D-amino acid oxidase-like deaminating enzyme